mgnify:CR=1 FL=1
MERMRKFLKFLSQRIVIVTFLIFLQIMWFVGMFLKVTSYSQYITAAFKILSILVVIYIMNRSDNPSVKLGWIVVILLFPLFGGLLYLTIGGKQPISHLRRKLEPMIEESARHLKADPKIEQELKEKDGSTASQIYYLEHQSGFPAYKDSKVDYYPSGEDCFKVMAEELRKAKEYIYLEYFIIEEGIMWNTILDILEEKDVKITWAPSEDPEGSEVTYIVYVDGVIVSESDKTEYTLKNADESKDYSIRIVAVDASGNKAVPAVINLTVDDWNAKTVVGVEKPADLKVKKGTAADKLDLPKTVNVTLEGGRVADVLEVKWTTDNYKADQIGTQTLSGELQKKKGVKIPDKFKTVTINVIVEESEVNPPQPEDKVVIAVEKLADLTVKFGTPAEKLALPKEVKVTLDNKAKDKLSIVWNTDVYKADKAGTYKLTGTLQTKEGITIPEEFRKVTVNVTVEEKGKVPPTSGKEEGKNNSGAVQTGDDKNVWLPIAGLVAAIAVVAAVLIIKNKKKK